MEELMIGANMAIVFGVIYKVFELFVCRRERMMLIEKMGDKLVPETFKNGIMYRPSSFSFSGLRIGCLLLGLGAGLLTGYFLVCVTQQSYFSGKEVWAVNEAVSIIYGACVLLGGGLGLVISYLIEKEQWKKNK